MPTRYVEGRSGYEPNPHSCEYIDLVDQVEGQTCMVGHDNEERDKTANIRSNLLKSIKSWFKRVFA